MDAKARKKRRWRKNRFGLTNAINSETINSFLSEAIDRLTERELADLQASHLIEPPEPPALPPAVAEPLQALSEALTGWLWGQDPPPTSLVLESLTGRLLAACEPRRRRRPSHRRHVARELGEMRRWLREQRKDLRKTDRGDDTGQELKTMQIAESIIGKTQSALAERTK